MELKIHIPDVKTQLDPQKMEDAFSMMITLQLHRGLLRYNANGDVMADLAESWVESPDRLSYKFKLKKTTFSDGTPITTKNVQMTFARMFYVESSMAADIDYIKGVEDFIKTKDIKKLGIIPINDNEIEFHLSHPSAIFLKQIAVIDCSILPILDFKQNLLMTENGAFSGPYKLQNSNDTEFILKKWRKDEFDSSNPPEQITFFKTSEKPETLARLEKTDTLDHDVISQEAFATLKTKGWSSSPTELTGEVFVILNPQYVPLIVREELYQKTNSQELLKFLKDDQFIPAYGLIPNGFLGVLSEKDVSDLNSNKKEYSGKKTSFKLDYLANSEFDKKLAQWLKFKWDTPHIEVILNELPHKEKLSRMFSKQAEATIGKKGTDYPDGYSVLAYFKGKYDANYFHVDDPKIDQAIGEAAREFDTNKRDLAYKNIQKKILKHYTNIPLYFGSQASGLWSSKVKKVPPHSLGYHTMPFESIEMRSR